MEDCIESQSIMRLDDLNDLRILVVDDQESNTVLLERLLEDAGYRHVYSERDSRRVEELCAELDPHLILLDLHMPGLDGFAVMERLRPRTAAGRLMVLVLTGDLSAESKRHALSLGARDFLSKPFDFNEVLLRVRNLLETRWLQLRLEHENDRLAQRVAERTEELALARRELLDRLALVAERRDYTTAEHTQRMARTASLVAERIGLAPELVEMLSDAAPLHDIGKLGISDRILLKPGPLDPEEISMMRGHVRIGAEILGSSHSPVLRLAEEIALFHHEWWDGSGYAAGLAGDAIPVTSRITAIADVFDALTHERPYKPAFSVEFAVTEIANYAGRQFDPALVDVFLSLDHEALI